MHPKAALVVACLVIVFGCPLQGWGSSVVGQVIDVPGATLTATFPVPIRPDSVMIVRTGDGEGVAGMAISEKCSGTGPYKVTAKVAMVTDADNFTAGKNICVDSANALAAPSCRGNAASAITRPAPPAARPAPPMKLAQSAGPADIFDRDLNFYYYAAGQTVGYGAFGLGYDHSLRISQGMGLELDGAIAALGSVNGANPRSVNTDQRVSSASGRLKFDFSQSVGTYAAYRWSEAEGRSSEWNQLSQRLQGTQFIAASEGSAGTVLSQGIEYGFTILTAGPAQFFAGLSAKAQNRLWFSGGDRQPRLFG